jgi:hypothetical protein
MMRSSQYNLLQDLGAMERLENLRLAVEFGDRFLEGELEFFEIPKNRPDIKWFARKVREMVGRGGKGEIKVECVIRHV